MFKSKLLDKIKTHILYSITYFRKLCLCDVMGENFVESDRPRMTIWRMRIESWIHKGYKHTSRICSTYYFSTATMVCKDAPHCYVIRKLHVLYFLLPREGSNADKLEHI